MFDDVVSCFEFNIFVFNLYFVSNLYLFLLFNVFLVFCKYIKFFFLDKKLLKIVLFLYIILWYVKRNFVFVIIGFLILFLYFFNVLNLVMFSLNMFSVLFKINICGFFEL